MATTRQRFHDELARLEEAALGGLDLVVEQLDRVMEALEHQDVELAAIVIHDDDRLDGRYLEVHQGVLSLLALQAKAAFVARDSGMAEDLVRRDRDINRLNREIFQTAIEVGDDADTREWAMHMMLVARWIERIGDNAVDIGEQTAFVVSGLFREFSDSSTPALRR